MKVSLKAERSNKHFSGTVEDENKIIVIKIARKPVSKKWKISGRWYKDKDATRTENQDSSEKLHSCRVYNVGNS